MTGKWEIPTREYIAMLQAFSRSRAVVFTRYMECFALGLADQCEYWAGELIEANDAELMIRKNRAG